MKEEDNIIKRYGKKNPFIVPEGYFDNLTSEIMNKLPEKEPALLVEKQISTWQKVRPWIYMAAMFIAILLPIRFIVNHSSTEKDTIAATTNTDNTELDDYIDLVMKQSVMDDYTLYLYLTDADTDYHY